MDTSEQLLQERLVAVIRADDQAEGYAMVKAAVEGGMKAIEVTFTIPHAEALIASLKREFGDAILLGAGTVLDLDMCKRAIEHGAQYIVSPGFVAECADYCHKHKVPYIPGCMTVSEMMQAMNHHAGIIKLFPGSHFDPGYVKSIKAPLPELKIMVTGGVDLRNMENWFAHGADMVGIGGALTKHAKTDGVASVSETARQYIDKLKGMA